MTNRRPLLASLAALTAAFSVAACGNSGPITDQTGAVVQGVTNTIGGYDVHEIESSHQPDAVIITFDTYSGGGVAIVSTVEAAPGPAQLLRRYEVDGNTIIEFTPSADSNTVCTLLDGYESGALACARVNRPTSAAVPAGPAGM